MPAVDHHIACPDCRAPGCHFKRGLGAFEGYFILFCGLSRGLCRCRDVPAQRATPCGIPGIWVALSAFLERIIRQLLRHLLDIMLTHLQWSLEKRANEECCHRRRSRRFYGLSGALNAGTSLGQIVAFRRSSSAPAIP